MAKKKGKKKGSKKSGRKGCVPKSVALKANGRLRKGFRYGKGGGCIRRAKGK